MPLRAVVCIHFDEDELKFRHVGALIRHLSDEIGASDGYSGVGVGINDVGSEGYGYGTGCANDESNAKNRDGCASFGVSDLGVLLAYHHLLVFVVRQGVHLVEADSLQSTEAYYPRQF